ncbi:MAG: hypothetical protein AABX03_02190 [Nanoarchaeota archaeon]
MGNKEVFTTIIVGISTIIVLILINIGFFAHPNIIPVRQGNYFICPDTVYSDFDVVFRNEGGKLGNLCVKPSSELINFTDDFDCLIIPISEPATFKFPIDKNSLMNIKSTDNISIVYSWNLNNQFNESLNRNTTCYYKKEIGRSNIVLIGQSPN